MNKHKSCSVLLFLILVGASTFVRSDETKSNNEDTKNLAEDLMETAESAGIVLTLEDINRVENAESDKYLEELYPMPVAEKLIGHRRRNNLDILRDQMIGMIFTGKPQPLGYNIDNHRRRPESSSVNRRRFRTRPLVPDRPRFFGMSELEKPSEILKPIPFMPTQNNVQFPMAPLQPAEPRPRRPNPQFEHRPRRPNPSSDHRTRRPNPPLESRPPSRRPNPTPRLRSKPTAKRPDFRPIEHNPDFGLSAHSSNFFGNHVGPDFGPVTYEEFESEFSSGPVFEDHEVNFPNNFHKPTDNFHKPLDDFDKHPNNFNKRPNDFDKRPNNFRKPPKDFQLNSHSKPPKPSKHPSGFSSTKFGSFDEFPKFEDFSNLGNQIPPNFDSDLQKFESPASPPPPLGSGYSDRGKCHTYTEDICLDAENYPHEAILNSLAGDPARTTTLMAEVRDQSADDLVDGISAEQESRYDFAHYFGNRRQDTDRSSPRDFAQEGGYLCPSEVKYARPKRARNSKGQWKFVVNMDKYTQTIRMEKCMKPGGTCSYVSHHYRAMCNQINNYQRLLSWNKERGLHMDIFKVPSCCSCHIQGYAYVFPPLNKHDPKVSRSDTIDTVTKLDDMEDINKVAPPFSPVNYPNLPNERETNRRPESNGNRKRYPWTTDHRNRRPTSPRRRSDQPDRINYGYHPILDFMKNRPNR